METSASNIWTIGTGPATWEGVVMNCEASVYLEQIRDLAGTLKEIADEVPAEQFNRRPGPHLNPVGWNYFHVLRVWDMYLNWECREQPHAEDAWHRGGFTGKSGYNPDGKGGRSLGIGFAYTDDEVDEIQIDPEVLKQYLRMLMTETEEFLAGTDEDEMRRVTHSTVHPGQTNTVSKRMQHLILHSTRHAGEMRYALGALGWRDPSYPGLRA
jgi:hypothetical protein